MSTQDSSAPRRLEIRKYPNRRYYDTTRSRHLTLEQIRVLIRDGCDIKAVDSKTGADITAQVLTQIILEFETPKIDAFPVPLLVHVIRSSNQAVRESVERYFNQALGAYADYQRQMEEQMRRIQGLSGLFPPSGAWPQSPFNPFAQGFPQQQATPPQQQPPPPPSGNAAPRSTDSEGLRDVLSDLQRQVTELKDQLKKARTKRKGQ